MAKTKPDALIQQYRASGAKSVLLGLTDIDGVLRGKFVNLDKFGSLLNHGGGFCDCVFGWDVADELYESTSNSYTGWHTGFPDTHYRLLTSSERFNPLTNTPFFLGEFCEPDGADHLICPRTLLRRVLKLYEDADLQVEAGFEYEFFVFQESSTSLREKGYSDLEPFTEGSFGYSVLRASTNSPEFTGLMELCDDLNLQIEGLHCETGPGVWEACLQKQDVLEAADRASLFKTFCKSYLQQQDLIGTFMAKWSMKYPGQSGHFHVSIKKEDRDIFSSTADGLSPLASDAVGGLVELLPEFLVMFAPTVNSYTRLTKGAWAPTSATWGIENRTCAVRYIKGTKGDRIEHRVPGADSNPYLVAAATLGAIYLGLLNQYKLGAPISGNAYDIVESNQKRRFSSNLRDATNRFSRSKRARELFGEPFVDHYVETRLHEARAAESSVNDWQLKRYFEII